MYREVQPDLRHINLLFDNGGLGDCIARLPAVDYAVKNNKHIKFHLWVPDYFKEFAINCMAGQHLFIRGYSENKKYKAHFLARCFAIHKYDNMASHLTDNAFHVLVNKDVGPEDMNYLKPDLSKIDITRFNLPEKYVVMTSGFTANAREMYPQYINQLVDYIIAKGYEIVWLGKTVMPTGISPNGKNVNIIGEFNKQIDYSKGINLIDKSALLESCKIVSQAKTIVGLDNGLLHLAGCTDIPIVGAFSSVEPKYRMPYRNNQLGWNFYPVVPSEDLKCRFCQSNWTFTYNHEFTECYYKDYQCLKQLAPERYIEQLEKIL